MLLGTRTLRLQDGPDVVDVVIRMFAPERGEHGEWSCRYTIGWPHGPEEGSGSGFDALQAVLLTMKLIAGFLYASPYHASGQLYWDKPGSGYGFPVTPNLRDLLVGDDKIFEG